MTEKSGVQAVHLALDILEEFIPSQDEIGVSELTARLGSTKGTVFRHLQTLVRRGYLAQDPGTLRYRLSARAYLLGQAAMSGVDLLTAGADAISQLRTATGQTAVLSSVSREGVSVLSTIIGIGALEIGVRPGSHLPLHASAQGKVALAFCRPGMLTDLRRRELARLTTHTIVDVAEIEQGLPQIRAQGWASAPQEMLLGINGIAAPVLDGAGQCVGAIALVGSIQHVMAEPSEAQLAAILDAAHSVSRALGYRP